MKTGWILRSSGHESNPQFESLRIGLANPDLWIYEVRFVNHNTKRTFLESGFVTTMQNESMFLQISYTIPETLYWIEKKHCNSSKPNSYKQSDLTMAFCKQIIWREGVGTSNFTTTTGDFFQNVENGFWVDHYYDIITSKF